MDSSPTGPAHTMRTQDLGSSCEMPVITSGGTIEPDATNLSCGMAKVPVKKSFGELREA